MTPFPQCFALGLLANARGSLQGQSQVFVRHVAPLSSQGRYSSEVGGSVPPIPTGLRRTGHGAPLVVQDCPTDPLQSSSLDLSHFFSPAALEKLRPGAHGANPGRALPSLLHTPRVRAPPAPRHHAEYLVWAISRRAYATGRGFILALLASPELHAPPACPCAPLTDNSWRYFCAERSLLIGHLDPVPLLERRDLGRIPGGENRYDLLEGLPELLRLPCRLRLTCTPASPRQTSPNTGHAGAAAVRAPAAGIGPKPQVLRRA